MAGEPLTAVQGKLIKCGKHTTKTGDYGDYTMQFIDLSDGTGVISVTLFDQNDLTKYKGKNIIVSAGKDKNGKQSGLDVQERDVKGKMVIQVKASGLAQIDCGVEGLNGDEPPEDEAPPTESNGADDEEAAALQALEDARKKKAERLKKEAEAKAADDSRGKSDAKGPSSYPDAKRRIIQITNLYDYAMKSAKRVLQKNGLELTDIYTATATCFIAMRDDNLTDAMPMVLIGEEGSAPPVNTPAPRPADPAYQPDAPEETYDQEPTTWQDTVIHFGTFQGKKLGEIDEIAVEMLFSTFSPKMDPATKNYPMKDLYLKNALLAWHKEQS